jgi:hypothetical protein
MLAFLIAVSLLVQATSRTVLATVFDQRNRAIVDVGVDDFVIREAGESRDVLDVHVADYPIAVLIDTGRAAQNDFDTIKKAAARFITRVGQRPIVLGSLGDPPVLLTTFEDERPAVLAKLEALTASASSGSAVFQGVAAGARAIHDTGAQFSAIVVISASNVDSTNAGPGDLLRMIFDSGAIVHVVANRSLVSRTPGGVAGRYADLLKTLADETRGQYTTIYSQASYQVALDHLADRLSTEMMIQYIVPPGAARTDDVKLGVRLPGARVRGLGVR